ARPCFQQREDGRGKVRGVGRGEDLVVHHPHRLARPDPGQDALHERAALPAAAARGEHRARAHDQEGRARRGHHHLSRPPGAGPGHLVTQRAHEGRPELARGPREEDPHPSIFRASRKSRSVSPPESWLVRVRVTRSYSIRKSGWWSASSARTATRLTKAMADLKPSNLD